MVGDVEIAVVSINKTPIPVVESLKPHSFKQTGKRAHFNDGKKYFHKFRRLYNRHEGNCQNTG